MTFPETGIVTVRPKNTAIFTALRWTGTEADDKNLRWLTARFGWQITGTGINDGVAYAQIVGKNRKTYRIKAGEWIVALGTGGSLRVCSDREFHFTYEKVT